jgi:tRNA threonylcarbamoyladenosine biosynthesis protein TsaB
MEASMRAATVLGVDTATADTAVALTVGDQVVFERATGPEDGGRPRHAEALLGEIEAAAEAAGGWEAVGVIGVGVGPGTFTGLRVGIATVRALAQARGLAVAPVSSLAALARGIGFGGSRPGLRLPLIDARRGEVFAALAEPDGSLAWEPFIASPDQLAERLAELSASPLAAGDGSLRFRAQLEAAGVDVLPDADPAHRIAARHVCAIAAEMEPGWPEQVKPIYLRRPDAEVWRERGHRGPKTGRR